MTTLAVMQPYFMPYVGYFQLVDQVDRFVFLDDVNFIKKGWIHRNRILNDEEPWLFSIPLREASQNKKINEISLAIDERWKKKFFATLDRAYRKAPFFETTREFVRGLLDQSSGIAELAKSSVVETARYVGLATDFVDSSSGYENSHITGQARILDICTRENARCYINPQNGRSLYSPEVFEQHDIVLRFSEAIICEYDQQISEFVGSLSMIDIMMFNSPAHIRELVANGRIAP